MFGYLRFFLATLVLLSHIGVRVYSLNPGVFAVVIFYMLAGFVVSHLLHDVFLQKHRILNFYKDRVKRIFPLYLYALTLTLLFVLLTSFGEPHFRVLATLSNLLIVPLNYYMYVDSSILTVHNVQWWLIPPAWSLGTELQAYLLLPFALLFKKARVALFLLSLSVYLLANFSFIDPDVFGYRLIVGVFFIFLLGVLLQEYHKEKQYLLVSIYILLLLLLLIFTINHSFSAAYTKETLFALLIGMPLIFSLQKLKKPLPFNHIMGSLSYGIFLTHFLSIWILNFLGYTTTTTVSFILKTLLLSLILSSVGLMAVEKRVRKEKKTNK